MGVLLPPSAKHLDQWSVTLRPTFRAQVEALAWMADHVCDHRSTATGDDELPSPTRRQRMATANPGSRRSGVGERGISTVGPGQVYRFSGAAGDGQVGFRLQRCRCNTASQIRVMPSTATLTPKDHLLSPSGHRRFKPHLALDRSAREVGEGEHGTPVAAGRKAIVWGDLGQGRQQR